MNRNCMFNHELLVSYASGSATPDERSTVERHLAGCAECRREIVELESVWWALDTWQMENVTTKPRLADLRRRLVETKQVQPLWTRIRERFTLNVFSVRPLPAAAMAVIACMLLLYPSMQSLYDPTAPIPSGNPSITHSIAMANPSPEPVIDPKEKEFQDALMTGEDDRELNRLVRVRSSDPNSIKLTANYGFVLSKDNFIENAPQSAINPPSTVQLTDYDEVIRFE